MGKTDCSVKSLRRENICCPLESLESEYFCQLVCSSELSVINMDYFKQVVINASRITSHIISIGSEMVWANGSYYQTSSSYYHLEIDIKPLETNLTSTADTSRKCSSQTMVELEEPPWLVLMASFAMGFVDNTITITITSRFQELEGPCHHPYHHIYTSP